MAHLKKILIDTKCGRIFEARQHLFREMASPIQYSPGPWISSQITSPFNKNRPFYKLN